MEIKATHRFARISPLKARDVAREMTGLKVSDALDLIQFTPKKAAVLLGKTLKSAVANAENNFDLSADDLLVKSATVSDGPAFRRYKPRARGGAAPIRKRTAHLQVILTDEAPLELEREEPPARPAAKKKAPAKAKAPAKKESPQAEREPEGEAAEDEK